MANLGPQSAAALTSYYQSLLIIQYLNLPNAMGTIAASVGPAIIPQTSIQTLTFSATPTSGSFVLGYGVNNTVSIPYNDSAATIQTDLQALSGLGSVTVSGAINQSTGLTITFTGVAPPALVLTISSNTLSSSSGSVTATVSTTDVILPLAVQNAYNLTGSSPAVGVQLDVLGKYAGVSRSGFGFNGTPITLDDSQFLRLIQLAIIKNNAGSSLSIIQSLLSIFFSGEILVFDNQSMELSYIVNSNLTDNLVQLFITEGLLPKPMGVVLSVIVYVPSIDNIFGFRTYDLPAFNASGFNTYDDYHEDWPWLSYSNTIGG